MNTSSGCSLLFVVVTIVVIAFVANGVDGAPPIPYLYNYGWTGLDGTAFSATTNSGCPGCPIPNCITITQTSPSTGTATNYCYNSTTGILDNPSYQGVVTGTSYCSGRMNIHWYEKATGVQFDWYQLPNPGICGASVDILRQPCLRSSSSNPNPPNPQFIVDCGFKQVNELNYLQFNSSTSNSGCAANQVGITITRSGTTVSSSTTYYCYEIFTGFGASPGLGLSGAIRLPSSVDPNRPAVGKVDDFGTSIVVKFFGDHNNPGATYRWPY